MKNPEAPSRLLRWCALAAAIIAISIAVPAAGSPEGRQSSIMPSFSQIVAIRQWLAHPATAPADLRTRLQRLAATASASRAGSLKTRTASRGGILADVFVHDPTGLPQNEESVGVCRRNVLEGTNDYRGLVDPTGDFTGWSLSRNGGRSVTSDGLLPALHFGGIDVPSGGDPVDRAGASCSFYAADLNYTNDLENAPNGVGIYRSTPRILASCGGGTSASCWPAARAAAFTTVKGHFLDKPWMDAGKSGSAGEVVWVTYTEFTCPNGCDTPPFTNQIKAVRCTADLSQCTQPILLSGAQNSLQDSYVTIGADGRTYVTWEEDNDLANNFQPPEHMRFWLRVAQPGSTTFGPMHLVANEPRNVGLALLHADSFRENTIPKNTVAMVHGHPRVFVTWEGCRVRVLGDSVCEEPAVKLAWSDDFGESWRRMVVSAGGDNYFATVSADPDGHRLAVAYWTSRHDPIFHNRQDLELVSLDVRSVKIESRQRLTHPSNEPEADPVLGAAFIGDYIEVTAQGGTAYVGYNANYRHERLLGEGVPIPQQDNYLTRATL